MPSTWQDMNQVATRIGAGGGIVVILGTTSNDDGYNIVVRDSSGNWGSWNGMLTSITADPSGHLYGVNKENWIWQGISSLNWNQLPGAGRDIGVGADGSIWVIGTDQDSGVTADYQVFKWNGTGWDRATGSNGVRIAVDSTGTAWVLDSQNKIWQTTLSGHTQELGLATDIACGPDGSVYCIGLLADHSGHTIYRRDLSNPNHWVAVAGPPSGAAKIAVDSSGHLWAINAVGEVYCYS